MLGVALTAQRAGWAGDQPIVINITAPSAVTYELYQEPAFSWILNTDYGSDSQYYAPEFSIGNIDTTGYADLSGFNSKNWTTVVTFNLTMPAGLSSNEGIKIDTRFRGGDGDFTSNWAWVYGYSNIARLQINCAASRGIEMPEDGYQAYNGRWLTVVASSSSANTVYTNWQPGQSFGTPVYFQRTAVFDSETGELITKVDEQFDSGQAPIGVPADLAGWMADAGNTISTDRNEANYSYSIAGPTDSQANVDLKIQNWWTSYGTMFDPLTETDRSWLTTRPSEQIGNAVAWFNGQMTSYGNTANYAAVWSTDAEMDLFTPDDAGRGMRLIETLGNSTVFNDLYSTDFVKSRNT